MCAQLRGAIHLRPTRSLRSLLEDGGFSPNQLKSVSGDLLGELEEITEAQEQRENRIAKLEGELETKEERIRDLERQLSEARNLKQMADRFSRAIIEQVTGRPLSTASGRQSELEASTGERGDRPTASARDGTDSDDLPDQLSDESGGTSDEDASAPGTTADTAEPDPEPTVVHYPDTDESPPVGESLVDRLQREIAALDEIEREMLRHYRTYEPATPQEAHAAVGGSGDRTDAYAANRSLRRRGLVEHAAKGTHGYALPALVAEEAADPFTVDGGVSDAEYDRLVRAVEASFVDDIEAPLEARSSDGKAAGDSAEDTADSSGAHDGAGAWPDP